MMVGREDSNVSRSRHQVGAVAASVKYHAVLAQLHVHLPRPDAMFASFHVYTFSVELNSFQFQARSLLLRCRAAQLDLPSSAYHTMPRQLIDGIGAQETGDGAMVPRITSCCS